MNIRDYGFSKLEDEATARIEALLEALDDEQLEALRPLGHHVEVFFEDARSFMRNVVETELSNKSISLSQRKVNIELAMTHTILRVITHFMLATGEALQFGGIKDLPPMETSRLFSM